MKKIILLILIGIVGVALNWLSLQVGWWWITPIMGLLIGLFIRWTGASFLVSLCMGSFGWGLPLAILALKAPTGIVANAVESVIGLSATGGIVVILLTVLLGSVLSVVGTWVGVAVRIIIRRLVL